FYLLSPINLKKMQFLQIDSEATARHPERAVSFRALARRETSRNCPPLLENGPMIYWVQREPERKHHNKLARHKQSEGRNSSFVYL
ncbi:MAG: hypothetical protein MI975_28560, partial [Cytophagales bacterium]|nr:hypothetical protein [Cytophagales bacterium]